MEGRLIGSVTDPFDPLGQVGDWIRTAVGGDADLAEVVRSCLERARRMHCSVFVAVPEGAPVHAFVKIFRGAAVLLAEGRVRSTEFLRIADPDGFFARLDTSGVPDLTGASWDDRASFFSEAAHDLRLSRTPSLLDRRSRDAVKWTAATLRFFEYFLNDRLRDDPRGELILSDEPCVPVETSIPVVPNRPLRPHLRTALEAVLTPIVDAEAGSALDNFVACLDAGALDAMRRGGLNGCRWYNWMMGLRWDDGTIDAPTGLRRRQALAAYPLAHCLIAQLDHPVNEAVERASPLVPTLAAALGIDERTVRNLNGIGAGAVGLPAAPDEGRLRAIAAQVARLPAGAKPKGDGQWRAFFAVLQFADRIAATGWRDGTPAAEEEADRLVNSAAGRWASLDVGAVEAATAAFPDMVADFLDNVVHPAALVARRPDLADAWDPARITRAIVGGRTLPQVLEATVWWTENQTEIRARLEASYPKADAGAWPPLHEGVWRASNGLSLVCLTDQRMLDEEHRRMSHCVNTYAARCLYDGRHIVSVRTVDGRVSLSTAEIAQDKLLCLAGRGKHELSPMFDVLPPGVVQHRAPNNREPSVDAKEALWDYVGRLLSGAIKIDTEGLARALDERRRTMHVRCGARSTAHFNTTTAEAVRAAWEEYEAILPGRVRKSGPSYFLKGEDTDGLPDARRPRAA